MSLLIDGALVDVPGVQILSPGAESWNTVTRGQVRVHTPQLKILHKTIADDRETVVDADAHPEHTADWAGCKATLDYWHSKNLSGTHLITGHNGDSVCTADLVRFIGWHANQANNRSWGHEIKEHPGGGVQRAALEAAVAITLVDTSAIGVQWQCPKRYIANRPFPRFSNGGADLVGVFGHRDVTDQRGYWDPGDTVFDMLAAKGFERFDFYGREDLDVWSERQEWLAKEGFYKGAIDGIAGQGTTAALKACGFPAGIFCRWRELAEKPPLVDRV